MYFGGFKMENKTKTTGKTEAEGKTLKIDLIDDGENKVYLEATEVKNQRVVLNLTEEQAQRVAKILVKGQQSWEDREFCEKIARRMERTILKQAFIQRCIEDGIGKPNKEAMKKFMEGIK